MTHCAAGRRRMRSLVRGAGGGMAPHVKKSDWCRAVRSEEFENTGIARMRLEETMIMFEEEANREKQRRTTVP
jgi:hypothetical protein